MSNQNIETRDQNPETSQLKPCPFCGGEAGLLEHNEYFAVKCVNYACDVDSQTDYYPEKSQAIAIWNTRAERTAKVETSGEGSDYCGNCGEWVDKDESRYCQHCGARLEWDD